MKKVEWTKYLKNFIWLVIRLTCKSFDETFSSLMFSRKYIAQEVVITSQLVIINARENLLKIIYLNSNILKRLESSK